MRILSITSSFPVTAGSNSGIFVKRLVDELARENEVTVITPAYKDVSGCIASNPEVIATRYAPEKFQMLCHGPGGIPARLKSNKLMFLAVPPLLLALFLKTLLHAKRHDVIQANWAICGAIAGAAGWLTGTPVVTTLRGDDVNSARKSMFSRFFLSMAIKLSKAVVTVSDDIREQLTQKVGIAKSKVSTIPNGVNDEFLSRGQQGQPTADSGKLTLITVGSLIPRKNVSFLITALSKLPAHIELTVVGDGEERDSLVELSKTLQLDARVRFAGAIDPEEIPGLLARHDVFVISSFSEGRSNAIYEAMACGKPILASDIPGTREQITHRDTGFLFPLASDDEFVELVRELDKHRDVARTTGEKAHRWIVDNGYTWQAAKKSYLALFQQHCPKQG